MSQWDQNKRLWSSGKPVEGPDAETDNRSPFLTADNHDLFFATKIVVKDPNKDLKPMAANFDIVRSLRVGKVTQFTGPTPVQSVCTSADELHPWLTPDGRELYFSRKTKAGWRVFVASRATAKEAFGEPKEIKELPDGFHHATLDKSGKVMYLHGPLKNNRWGLFRTRRVDVKQPWDEPVPLDALNCPDAPTGDMSPSLSRDGTRLYFVSDRPGGKGKRDIWSIDTTWFSEVNKPKATHETARGK
jgi:Tol biopolymer transport system component